MQQLCNKHNDPDMGAATKILKKIILIDDDEDLLFTLNYWLLKKGFITIALTDADALSSFIESFQPNLILIDMNLRNKDGRDVCRYVKKDLRFDGPVVLFSVNDYINLDYSACSASGFFQKSSDHLSMVSYVSQYL